MAEPDPKTVRSVFVSHFELKWRKGGEHRHRRARFSFTHAREICEAVGTAWLTRDDILYVSKNSVMLLVSTTSGNLIMSWYDSGFHEQYALRFPFEVLSPEKFTKDATAEIWMSNGVGLFPPRLRRCKHVPLWRAWSARCIHDPDKRLVMRRFNGSGRSYKVWHKSDDSFLRRISTFMTNRRSLGSLWLLWCLKFSRTDGDGAVRERVARFLV